MSFPPFAAATTTTITTNSRNTPYHHNAATPRHRESQTPAKPAPRGRKKRDHHAMYQPLEQPRQALSSSNAMAQTVSTTLFTAEQDRTQTPPFPSPEPRLIAPSTIYNNGNRQHGYRAAPSPPRCICTETHTHTSAEARVHSHTHSDPELRIQDAMSFVQYVMDTLPEKTFSRCRRRRSCSRTTRPTMTATMKTAAATTMMATMRMTRTTALP